MALSTILTFDYELFLGNPSGHAQTSLLDPTEKILDIFKKYKAKGVFFIDVCFLERCRKDAPELYALISAQIKKMYQSGHELGVHTHPHWVDAHFSNDQWSFCSFDKFRLHTFESQHIVNIFKTGVESLQRIVSDDNFLPKSFRAGGWCVQPFADLSSAFRTVGLKIDSSVVPGLFSDKRPLHYYDFLNAPSAPAWKFSEDPLHPNDKGDLIEMPVTVLEVSGLELFVNKILLGLKNQKPFGDGRGVFGETSKKNQLKRIFKTNLRKFSVESTSLWLLKRMLRRVKNKRPIHFVMHPKSLTPHALDNIEYILKNYTSTTIFEAAKNMGLA